MDWILAFAGVCILSPLLIIIGLAVRLSSRGPVIFVQQRIGKNGRVFDIYKFRTMFHQPGEGKGYKGFIYKDDPNITRVGRFLRRTSLDELPQLINILKGEMSFIGPRPPVLHFPKRYEEYNEYEKQRFLVKPGISGLHQVYHRELHDWDTKIPIDVDYVKNQSFRLDVKLFFLSLASFIKTDKAYPTMLE